MELKLEDKGYRLVFLTEMLGTVPKDPEVYKTFIESKKPESVTEEEYLTVEKIEEKGWTGFRKDENGLFILDYMIRGFLKAAGEAIGPNFKVEKAAKKGGAPSMESVKGIKSKVDKFCFVFPRRIYLGTMEPHDVVERPLRAMTMQGPRVTLARSDSVKAGTTIDFIIKLIPNSQINFEMIDYFMQYGQYSGLGQFRNGSYGRFAVAASTTEGLYDPA